MTKIYAFLCFTFLLLFTAGMLINLGNIAFWEDEGETIQYGKTILKFGYPSVFDGRSFILLDQNYHPQNYLRYTSPFLQFYLSAIAIALFKNPADTFLMRLPFALFAVAGIWTSWFIFKKFKYSGFSLFLYSLFLSTSVQLYLYWRQARHYALQFPLALGLLYSYLNLGKRGWNILFLVFGFLFYHAYYPGFAGFYLGIVIHAIIRKYLDKSYRLKPLIVNTLILISILLPSAVYLKHYGQLPNNGYLKTLAAYLMDLNYFGYFKIAIISIAAILLLKRPGLACHAGRRATARPGLNKLFRTHRYSVSLFSLVIASHLLLASFGAHNQRYISVLIPFIFLLAAVSWNAVINAVITSLRGVRRLADDAAIPKIAMSLQVISLPILVSLVFYSHPGFTNHLSGFIRELRSEYYGPIEGIVNTISGVDGLKPISPNLPKQPETLIATNFEDGAIYAYLNNQFLNSLAPTEKYRTGDRLPDWIIIRQHWGQENYLQSFLQTGNYQKIETPYCDLPYENVYLVRTHLFQTPSPCPEGKLILYRLSSQ